MSDVKSKTDADKDELELRKLRWELSLWARAVGVAIPIAAIVIGLFQYQISTLQYEMSQRDLDLKMFENGVKAVVFTVEQTEGLLSRDPDKQRRTLTYTSELLPPDQACRVIKTVIISSSGTMAAVSPVWNMLAILRERHPKVVDCKETDMFARQDKIRQAFVLPSESTAGVAPAPPVAPPPAPPAPAPPAAPAHTVGEAPAPPVAPPPPVSSKCGLPPKAPKIYPLVTYYQIVQAEDRAPASEFGSKMPGEFPSAGIELVSPPAGKTRVADVRYYHEDHKDAAKFLACKLTEVSESIAHQSVDFKIHRLPKKFENLPQHRIEVWFPQIK